MTTSQEHTTRSDVKVGAICRPWVVNTAPTGRRPALRVGELWTHRELIHFFALRDLKVRYKQAFLGIAWAGIQPVAGAVTFTVLFNRLASVDVDGPSYFAFALLGSGVWAYFASTLVAGTNSLLYNAELLTKVAFPRIVAPVATLLPPLIDLAVAAALAFSIALASGAGVSLVRIGVGIPLGLALLVLAVAGPVLLLSAAVVKYRDVNALVGFGVQVLLFASPIAYPPSLVPAEWRIVLYINPLSGAVGILRWALVGTPAPTIGELAVSCTAGLALLLLGLTHFRRCEREFADII